LGPVEVGILFMALCLNVIPAFVFYRLAKRVGYETNSSVLWAIGYVVFGWLVLAGFAFADWPTRLLPVVPDQMPLAPTVE